MSKGPDAIQSDEKMPNDDLNSKIFCVFGARRTGTNYFEALIMKNFENPVANLNKGQIKNEIRYRPYLFDTKGSKHSFDDVEISVKLGDLYHCHNLVIVRSPLSWLDARIRYHLDMLKKPEDSINEETIQIWVSQEYVKFYQRAIDIIDDGRDDLMICRYEDASSDLHALMNRIADKFGYAAREWMDVDRIVAPGGRMSGISRNDHIKSRRVSDEGFLRTHIDKHCPKYLIDRLGY